MIKSVMEEEKKRYKEGEKKGMEKDRMEDMMKITKNLLTRSKDPDTVSEMIELKGFSSQRCNCEFCKIPLHFFYSGFIGH